MSCNQVPVSSKLKKSVKEILLRQMFLKILNEILSCRLLQWECLYFLLFIVILFSSSVEIIYAYDVKE